MIRYCVDVTAQDIRLGNKRNADWCPIARASTRAFGRPTCVGLDSICLYRGKTRRSKLGLQLPLPYAAQVWADAFDEGSEVAPFSFDLEMEVAP